MSFSEKSAWACLVTTVAGFVPYFVYVFRLSERGDLRAGSVVAAFIAVVVFQVVVNVVAHVVFVVRSGQERPDERDLAIELRSVRYAYGVLASSCFLATGSVVMFSAVLTPAAAERLLGPTLLSQIFLLCFVAGETTKYLAQAVSYRFGS